MAVQPCPFAVQRSKNAVRGGKWVGRGCKRAVPARMRDEYGAFLKARLRHGTRGFCSVV